MKKKALVVLILILVFALLMSSCAPAQQPEPETDPPETEVNLPDDPPPEVPPSVAIWNSETVEAAGGEPLHIQRIEATVTIEGDEAVTLAEMLHHPTESAYREIPSDALYIRVTEGMNNINVGWIWKADGATYLSYYNAGDAELSKEKSGEYPAIYTYDESVFDAFAAELENLIVP